MDFIGIVMEKKKLQIILVLFWYKAGMDYLGIVLVQNWDGLSQYILGIKLVWTILVKFWYKTGMNYIYGIWYMVQFWYKTEMEYIGIISV